MLDAWVNGTLRGKGLDNAAPMNAQSKMTQQTTVCQQRYSAEIAVLNTLANRYGLGPKARIIAITF
jgi:hypothetical protein